MLPFAQFRRQAQILILEILNVFLWLKFSPFLALNKIERFAKVSLCRGNRNPKDPIFVFYAVDSDPDNCIFEIIITVYMNRYIVRCYSL